MVVAAAAPLTVIAGTVPLGLAAGNGAAFPTTFALCCAILLLFAVGFCAMSRRVPNAGAFYSYVQLGLGRSLGLGSAFLALITYAAVQLAVFGYIGAVVDALVQHWSGPALPWWVWSLVVVVVVVVVGVLGYRHIELSGKVLGTLLIAEVTIVLVFAVAGMDPVTEVFAWMAGTATLGVLALMTLTCAAVLVFFRRSRVDTRVWHTLLAPALGLVGLLVCLVLTASNFPTLIGGSGGLAFGIGAVPVVAFAFGLIWSRLHSIGGSSPATPSPAADPV